MVRVTIDDDLRVKLEAAAEEVVDLVDESGNVVGRFLSSLGVPPAGVEPSTPPLDEEELQRRINSQEPGLSTQEVLEHLRSRP
ncbi:hypothetical protein MalM25_32740 [Planctomycetes bacterium MalM25]|nr:hypothetical protein MalM25_32740 [Planctomycetes bacterium MalM25]